MTMPFRPGAQEVSGALPLLFRAIDHLRLEGYVTSLTHDGMSLSMVSTHGAILDYYSKLLITRLRKAAPDFTVEVYFPASSEALLARFNEVLVNSSIQEAMDGKVSLAAPRIWIVHDASALPDHEIKLLARLVQHFPAANIRVVLLMTVASQKPSLLSSFGRSILCWDIEPPTPEQAENMLTAARAEGREAAVQSLLKKLSFSTVIPTRPEPLFAETQPPMKVLDETEPMPVREATSGAKWRWLSGGAAMLMVSALSVTMFHASSPGAAGRAWNWQAVMTGKNPVASAALPPALATTPTQPKNPGANAGAATAPAPLNRASAPTSVLGALGKPVEPVDVILPTAPRLISEEPIEPATERPGPTNRPFELLVGQGWVQQMPNGSFLIQHIALPSYQQAMLWTQRHPDLASARVVATYFPPERMPHYVVASGPFSSFSEAKAVIQRGGISKDSQIRSVLSMTARFAPAIAEDASAKRKEKTQ